jgi:hypothetical protein
MPHHQRRSEVIAGLADLKQPKIRRQISDEGVEQPLLTQLEDLTENTCPPMLLPLRLPNLMN